MEAKFADVPAALWRRIDLLIPPERDKPKGGRPPIPARVVMAGILYRLKTGCQWKALPNRFGSGSTCHLHFQKWVQLGVFEAIHRELLKYYDDRRGISWKWSSLDSASVKAPKGGDLTGPNPTDRAKSGVKRHILTDSRGVPIAALITGANVPDAAMVSQVLDAVPIRGSRGPRRPEHICLDKGYDYPHVAPAIRLRGIRPHIRRRGWASSAERRGAGSSSEPTLGTIVFEACSCGGSVEALTTSRCFNSRAA